MTDARTRLGAGDDRVRAWMAGLVDEMKEAGVLRSEAIEEAFRSVPRHLFVDEFLEPRDTGSGMDWSHPARRDTRLPRWRRAVYRDQTLVTAVDGSMPSSSSTTPSLMAAMIDEVGVGPGMRVLEVGTGTGYNAAILAWCVGRDGRVCSIENQVDLAERARERIGGAIPWRVHVHSGNGLHGDPEHAPFDRIVVTGSTRRVPAALLAQLEVGGRLIVDLRGGLTGNLLLVVRDDPASCSGRLVDSIDAAFIPLADGPPIGRRAGLSECLATPAARTLDAPDHFDPRDLGEHDSDLVWFVQWAFPSARYFEQVHRDGEVRVEPCLYSEDDRTVLRFTGHGSPPTWRVDIHGPDHGLLDRVVSLRRRWEAMGRPSRRQCRWRGWSDGSQSLVLASADGRVVHEWTL